MKKLVASALIISMLNACATRPDSVMPVHVSSLKYKETSCAAIATELADIDAKTAVVSASLDSKASTDAALTTLGFILWPVWLGLAVTGGKPEAEELARLKGEKAALEQASSEKKCSARK